MTHAPDTNLMGEFRKRLGVRNVDVCIGLATMPVAASGDNELVPAIGQLGDTLVFFPGAKAIDFEGVNEGRVLRPSRSSSRLRKRLASC